jgi:predicted nucleic acid-binding Zn ribbon protein
MASKNVKGKGSKTGKDNREARRMRTYRIAFIVISVILILTWVLSLVAK